MKFNGCKVFSATKYQDRDVLGEKVTEWLRVNPGIEIVETIVTQSSDQAYHCLVITIFYLEPVDIARAPLGKSSSAPGSEARRLSFKADR